jgi:hypothetical protein
MCSKKLLLKKEVLPQLHMTRYVTSTLCLALNYHSLNIKILERLSHIIRGPAAHIVVADL